MHSPSPEPRRSRIGPGLFVFAMLLVELILPLSQRGRWFPFNEHKGWTVLIAMAVVAAAVLVLVAWLAAGWAVGRRPQFGLLALLLFVVVCAVPCSWLAVELRRADKQRAAVAAVQKAGGQALYEPLFYVIGIPFVKSEPATPAWLRKLLGDDMFADVTYLDLSGRPFPDDLLQHLRACPQLTGLDVSSSGLTDAQLELVVSVTTNLHALDLGNTEVTDAGLQSLKRLATLRFLSLEETRITDAGLAHLKELGELEFLELEKTQVTGDGIKDFQRALPNCFIWPERFW